MYTVYINGKKQNLEEIRVSAYPFNRTWPGKQRDISQTEKAYMLRVFGSGKIEVDIVFENAPREVIVRPISKGVVPNLNGNKASFVINSAGKFSVEADGKHNALHLFYSEEKDYSDISSKATHRFENGCFYPGLIELFDGQSVYIGRNAVVHASLYAHDARDLKIFGEGILCADYENRTEVHGDLGFSGENEFSPEKVHTYGGIRTYRCKNVSVEGITVTDTASYAVSFFATENIEISNVNVVGLWKYNCDGIDFFNCREIFVENCFIRSFDDSMCMKGLTAFSYMNTENAIIKDCVFWCDWGKNLDIGLATACEEIKNITWENCDIIHNQGSCLTISNGQWADVHDIKFKNIRVEYSLDTLKQVLQEHDEQTYPTDSQSVVPALAAISDIRRTWQGNISYDDARTKIRNVLFSCISVFMPKELDVIPNVVIKKHTQSSHFENIQIEDVYINGIPFHYDVPNFE